MKKNPTISHSLLRGVCLMALGLCVQQTLLAQKISFKNDTVWVDQKAYAVTQKDGNLLNSFSLFSLAGEELLYAKPIYHNLPFYDDYSPINTHSLQFAQLIFFPSKQKIIIKGGGLGFRKQLIKRLVKNQLLENGHWNADNLDRFVLKYDETKH